MSDIDEVQKQRMNYKWVTTCIIVVGMFFLIGWGILPLLNFLFNSTKEGKTLRDALITPSFIPDNFSIQNAISDDLFITAWDLNNRSPRFFNKNSQKTYKEAKFNHDMSLSDMTWASACTPYYFKPAVIGGDAYISGDNLAMSPAMFAYYYVNEQKNVKAGDLRIVSVGATNELAEAIDTKASLLDWAVRLTSLTTAVKKHTMDYMTEHLLRKDGHEMHKIEIGKTRAWEEAFYYTDERLPTLEREAQTLIFTTREAIEPVLDSIVKEKFASQKPAGCTGGTTIP